MIVLQQCAEEEDFVSEMGTGLNLVKNRKAFLYHFYVHRAVGRQMKGSMGYAQFIVVFGKFSIVPYGRHLSMVRKVIAL